MLRRHLTQTLPPQLSPRFTGSVSASSIFAASTRGYLPGSDQGVIKSKHPSIMPALEKETSLFDQYTKASEKYSSQIATICGITGASRTFEQVHNRTLDYAKMMQHGMHLTAGDTILMMAPNCQDYQCIFYAALAVGARVLPMNPLYTPQELSHVLSTAEKVRAVFVYDPFKPVVQAALGLLQAKMSSDPTFKASMPEVFLFTDKTELPQKGHYPDLRTVRVDKNDTAVIPFSSGTTGLPKQIHLSNYSLLANMHQTNAALKIEPNSRFLFSLPAFHIFGMVVIMMIGHWQGAQQIIIPKFDVDQFFALCGQHSCTHLFVAPPMFLALLKTPTLTIEQKRDRLKTVKRTVSGAAPLGEKLQAQAQELFQPGTVIGQGWGMSELSPVGSVSAPAIDGIEEHKAAGHVGGPIADTEFRLVCTKTGEDVKEFGQPGEIWIRGPQVFKGYHREEDNEKSFDDHTSPDRWFKTGDIAVCNPDHTFTITDRAKELIKSQGMQVAPAELEALLQHHAAVAKAIVVGLPTDDGTGNELPYAQVQLQPAVLEGVHGDDAKKAALAEELKQYVAENAAKYKHLRGGLEIVELVPTSPTGKLLRRVVKDQKTGQQTK